MKNSLIRKAAWLIIILICMSIASVSYAEESKFIDEWGIFGLGSVYLTSSSLNITENEIIWPSCPSAQYQELSMEADTWTIHIPQLSCNGIRKNSGEGYIMLLKLSRGENNLKIKVYDFKGDIKKDKELAWGEFYRIPFDSERNFFGKIGNNAVSMHLNVSKKGTVEGYYSYDKYGVELLLKGKIDGTDIVLNVSDNDNNIFETFNGKYIDGNINGNWKYENKSLKFYLVREPWEDHYISCEEMKKYPDKVFSGSGVDLGSGAGSPNGVDYQCEGGLSSLKFMEKIYNLTESINNDIQQNICTGSIVHALWRYYHYSLLKAGIAPNILALRNEQWEQETKKTEETYDIYQQNRSHFTLWAHQSLYNFELYNTFWKEYNQVKPILTKHYKKKFNVSSKKASYYAENALNIFVGRITDYNLTEDNPDLTLIEKAIVNLSTTIKDLDVIFNQNTSQDELDQTLQNELDQALKVVLLYQRSQNILEFLLEKGAKINSGYESALFFALRNHNNVKWLLKHGADVNYENWFGKTALFSAIGFNDHLLVSLLIDHKANVNHVSKNKAALNNTKWPESPFYQPECSHTRTKQTPLMYAAQYGDTAMIKLLLKYGAKLDFKDEEGYNAADYALLGVKPDNLDYLKSLGLQSNVLKNKI